MAKVILTADVKSLGKRGDMLEVADGFARNFLLPRKLAMPQSAGSTAQAEAMRHARDIRDAKDREGAETVARTLVGKTIKISAKAKGDRLFGSIHVPEIIAAVQAQTNVVLDRKSVRLHDHLKTLGTHEVPVKLHDAVEFLVMVEVVAAV